MKVRLSTLRNLSVMISDLPSGAEHPLQRFEYSVAPKLKCLDIVDWFD